MIIQESIHWWALLTDLQKQQFTSDLLPTRNWKDLTTGEIQSIYYRTQEL